MTHTPRYYRLRRTVRFLFWAPPTAAALYGIVWSVFYYG